MSRRHQRSFVRKARHGSVFPLVAILLVAIMGIAALVIDAGVLLLSRRQLQSAATTAAREGLRFS